MAKARPKKAKHQPKKPAKRNQRARTHFQSSQRRGTKKKKAPQTLARYRERKLGKPEFIPSSELGKERVYRRERIRFKATKGRKLSASRTSAKKVIEKIRAARKKVRGKRESEEISIKISYRDQNGKRRTRWDNFVSKKPGQLEKEIERILTHYTYENSKGKSFSIGNFSIQHFDYETLKITHAPQRKLSQAHQTRSKTRKNRHVRH